MKNSILIAILLCYSIAGFGQENKQGYLLEADSTWYKEIIKFPISFAHDIKLEGFEELRFPPGWAKQDSPEFWSYVWVWKLNDIKKLSETELETNIQYYFDGLLGIGRSDSNKSTTAFFIETEASENGIKHIGKVKTFDTRFTKMPMTLYVEVESSYCKKENKSIMLFRFSPKKFNHDIWDTLKTVKLKDKACKT